MRVALADSSGPGQQAGGGGGARHTHPRLCPSSSSAVRGPSALHPLSQTHLPTSVEGPAPEV